MDEERRLEALELFLQGYYEPLKKHAVHQFHVSEDFALELLQEFILDRVIRKDILTKADRKRGKFRTLLIQSLNRFVIDHLRKSKAAKRSPEVEPEALEDLPESALDHLSESGQEYFNVEFAKSVVHQALVRMRERCERTNRQDMWRVFHERILVSTFEGGKPLPYEQLAPLLGVESNIHAANLLTSAKRMFARVFKSVVLEYEASQESLEREISELRHILSNA